MNEQLLEAAKKIIEWYDDENGSNPHSTEQCKEAYDDLRTAVNKFSINPPVIGSEASRVSVDFTDVELNEMADEVYLYTNDIDQRTFRYGFRSGFKKSK